MLELNAWIAIAVTLVVFSGFQLRRSAPSDVLFLGGLVAVTVTGVISWQQALAGFSNPAVLTIAGCPRIGSESARQKPKDPELHEIDS